MILAKTIGSWQQKGLDVNILKQDTHRQTMHLTDIHAYLSYTRAG